MKSLKEGAVGNRLSGPHLASPWPSTYAGTLPELPITAAQRRLGVDFKRDGSWPSAMPEAYCNAAALAAPATACKSNDEKRLVTSPAADEKNVLKISLTRS